MPNDAQLPVRVLLANDFEVIVSGLAAMLRPFESRIRLVDTCVGDEQTDRRCDVALFDTFGQPNRGIDEVQRLTTNAHVGRIAVYTWDFRSDLVEKMLGAGVSGYLSKALGAEALVEAIVQVAAGRQVISTDPVWDRHSDVSRAWPGLDLGLSERESEIVVLIAEGLGNLEIAATLGISINSIKAHIRHAYRKLGVQTRAQAVRFAVEHQMMRRSAHR